MFRVNRLWSRAAPARVAAIVLGRRDLYMLPTRTGLIYAVMLMTMLLAAVNYNNGLAYLLTFLLGSMAMVSMLHTHRNLAGLRVSAGPCAPVFAGEHAEFVVRLDNGVGPARFGVRLEHAGGGDGVDIAVGADAHLAQGVRAEHRGYLRPPPFVLATVYPVGLMRSWSHRIALDTRCLVYPRPGGPRPFEFSPDRRRYQEQGVNPEGDDFIGLRDYRLGDPPRHVSWKAAARGQGLYTKQFGGAGQDTVWLDWDRLAPLPAEARLSQLCRWVLDADAAGLRYGLRIPGHVQNPAHGPAHRHDCLAALALFGIDARETD